MCLWLNDVEKKTRMNSMAVTELVTIRLECCNIYFSFISNKLNPCVVYALCSVVFQSQTD